jgi:nitrile hydratase beta subunit
MNSVHDLGGMMGFGPVNPESNEPVFHAAWERRALAVTLAMGALGEWSIDANRFARERLPPLQYLASSYYQIWLAALRNLIVERGLVTAHELQTGRAETPARTTARPPLAAANVARALAAGSPCARPAPAPARFAVGDKVTTKTINPTGHTRLARYLRHHAGEIITVHGAHVFPDTSAQFKGENPQWLYTVKFAAAELWGPDADPRDSVTADLWEPYLREARHERHP